MGYAITPFQYLTAVLFCGTNLGSSRGRDEIALVRRVLVRRSPNHQGTRNTSSSQRTTTPTSVGRWPLAQPSQPLTVRAVHVGADEPRHFAQSARPALPTWWAAQCAVSASVPVDDVRIWDDHPPPDARVPSCTRPGHWQPQGCSNEYECPNGM